jgi:glutaredoxin
MIIFFKKLLFSLLVILLSILSFNIIFRSPVMASDEVNIHLFSSKYCPHCRQAEIFLKDLKTKQPALVIYQYEVSHTHNSQLLTLLAARLQVSGQGVPFILINNHSIIGFSDATSAEIDRLLNLEKTDTDLVAEIIKENQLTPIIEEIKAQEIIPDDLSAEQTPVEAGQNNQEVNLPLFGKINASEISLPLLTIMIGFIDGFNPCAMWVLIFLISLLMGMNDRRRMWLLGSVFILTSGFVYFLFMSAWLNFFLFIGLVNWIRLAIALLAIVVAIIFLKDFIKNKDGSCQVDFGGNKQKVFANIKEIVYRKSILWSLLGIILLAFSVNLLELVCSAGLPAVYTKLLSMSDLTSLQYYLYLFLYILVFMLDDLLVFIITMTTMKRVVLDTKYARYSHLIGGIVMLIIGLLMFFKPEWIMFG